MVLIMVMVGRGRNEVNRQQRKPREGETISESTVQDLVHLQVDVVST